MGSISGIFNIDGTPVDINILERMNNLNPFRGPDRHSLWTDGNVGLASRILFTTNESSYERQPSASTDKKYLIVFDGIIYNRDELVNYLNNKNILKELFTDSEIVVNLFSLCKFDSFEKLNGDYAFVIWDIDERSMICARDHIGTAPFYYHYDKNKIFTFASQINQILCVNDGLKQPNNLYIGEKILNIASSDESTLYQNIFRLPPASYLVVDEENFRKIRYWDIDPTYELKYRDDNEYTENFLHILRKSVTGCLRSNGPVATTLSGGLDSSSVTSLANDIIDNHYQNDLDLSIYSLIFPNMDCDEGKYISALTNHINKPSNKIELQFEDYNWCEDDIDIHMTLPFFPNHNMCKPIYQRLQQGNIRIMLTGQGGDEWLRGCYFYLSDFIRSGRFDRLLYEIIKLYTLYGMMDSTNFLYAYLFKPSIPKKARSTIRKFIDLITNNQKCSIPGWVNDKFARESGLRELIESEIKIEQYKLHSQNHNYNRLHDHRRLINYEDSERLTSYYSIQDRHPFNNKDIIEFCLSLPEYKKINSQYTKLILRKSMNGLLPDSIKTRTSKAFFSELILRTFLDKDFINNINNLKIAQNGWINPEILLSEYAKMIPYFKTNNPVCFRFMWQLGCVYSVEMWYRKIFGV